MTRRQLMILIPAAILTVSAILVLTGYRDSGGIDGTGTGDDRVHGESVAAGEVHDENEVAGGHETEGAPADHDDHGDASGEIHEGISGIEHDEHEEADDHEDHAAETAPGDHDDHDHAGIVTITEHELEASGIEISTAGPGFISRTLSLPGEIMLNGDRVVHIVPRVTGIVREVRASLGDEVDRGDVLAVMESRELADASAEYLASRERLALARTVAEREERLWRQKISSEQEHLDAAQALSEARIAHRAAGQKLLALGISGKALEGMPSHAGSDLTRYEIVAPASGTVIDKKISLGQVLETDTEVFLLADLDSVWVDINVYQKDLAFVKEGQAVSISPGDDSPPVRGTVDYLGPLLGRETRTALARMILPNTDGSLRPGTFVAVTIAADTDEVPVAIDPEALQTYNDRTVVFIPAEEGFEPHPVVAGRRSEEAVEILSGLEPGRRYVSHGAFNLKAKLVTGSLDSHAGHGH